MNIVKKKQLLLVVQPRVHNIKYFCYELLQEVPKKLKLPLRSVKSFSSSEASLGLVYTDDLKVASLFLVLVHFIYFFLQSAQHSLPPLKV